jgi:hypothetical protein
MTPFMPRPMRPRSGNALVLALGCLAVIAGILVTTSESMVQSVTETRRDVDRQQVIAAVNATLLRRERMLNEAITLGAEGFPRRFDPTYDYDYATVGFVGEENYGVDWIGDVQVRWVIEPARAVEGGAWKQNPRPDGERFELELPNSFLFRIRAEGRVVGPTGNPLARVQGVRYSSLTKEPLFRYIIFYSQEGAKGDIEFAHGPGFEARGSVHTNGAIYLGGGTAVHDPAILANASGTTLLGSEYINPANPAAGTKEAMVNAYDGIYRLSKSYLFSQANDLATSPITDWYDTDGGTAYPGEGGMASHYRSPPPAAATILDATFNGREINPQRVTADALATRDTGLDDKRSINGIKIRGLDAGTNKANDARDRFRTGSDPLEWRSDSLGAAPNGFNKKARSSENGGRIVRLPAIMGNRAFEAQRVRYDDIDGDPTTDDHAYARPLFLVNQLEVTAYPAAAPIMESPGAYLGYALGGTDLAMRRWRRSEGPAATGGDPSTSEGFNAWVVTKKDGGEPASPPERMGLIIRERMMPDLNYLSGTGAASSGPNYVPYAYGKHMRTTRWPYWPMDVSAQVGSPSMAGLDRDRMPNGTNRDYARNGGDGYIRHVFSTTHSSGMINRALQTQAYVEGGTLNAGSAAAEFQSWTESGNSMAVQRSPQYYRSNWRLFHVQRPQPDTTRSGLLATAYRDLDSSRSWLPRSGHPGPLAGTPIKTGLWPSNVSPSGINADGNTQFSTFLAGTSASGLDDFSIRWTGFVKASTTGAYTFKSYTDDGGRLWVNDICLADQWVPQGGGSVNDGGTQTTIQMEADAWVPIVFEMFEMGGGQKAILKWLRPDGVEEVIPASALCPPAGTSGGAIPRSAWTAIQAKVTPKGGPQAQKIGLMVKPQPARSPLTAAGETIVIQGETGIPTVGNSNQNSSTPLTWIATTPGALNPAAANANGTIMALTQSGTGDCWGGWSTASSNAPRLTFTVTLANAGTYYFWGRFYTPGSSYNSAYLKVSGPAMSTVGALVGPLNATGSETFGGSSLQWENRKTENGGSMSFVAPAPGNYTVEFAMCDARLGIDQFVLTTDPGLIPSGAVITAGPIPGVPGPATGLPYLADGADPYLAVAFSPARGVFAEYRGTKATSQRQTPTVWFAGRADDFGSPATLLTDSEGQMGLAPGGARRFGMLNADLVTTGSPTYTISDSGNPSTASTPPPADTGTNITFSEGDFTNWRSGASSVTISHFPKRKTTGSRSDTWRFTLCQGQSGLITSMVSTADFRVSGVDNSDVGKQIAIFATGMPAAATLGTGNPALSYPSSGTAESFDFTWSSQADTGDLPWANTGGFVSGTANGTMVVGGETLNYAMVRTVTAGQGVSDTYTVTHPSGKTIWWYDESNKPYKTLASGTKLSWADFQAKFNAAPYNGVAIKVPNMNLGVTLSLAVPFETGNPTNPTVGAPQAWPNGEGNFSFGIDRSIPVTFDQQSLIGNAMAWLTTGRPAVLPWNALWTSITNPPTTNGFPPNLWTGHWSGVWDAGNYPRRAGIAGETVTDAAVSGVGSPRWAGDQPSSWPPAGGAPSQVWLRIERNASTEQVTLKYAFTATPPTTGDWQTLRAGDGSSPVAWDLDDWSGLTDLLMGPVIQSGDRSVAASGNFSDVSVEFSTAQASPEVAVVATPADRLDYLDWESGTSTSVPDRTRYLAGQYQVFFGPYEITEDFFSYVTATGSRLADESWFYQHREFWSQSRWWNDGSEKDPGKVLPTNLDLTNRELLARTTVLNLDLGAVWTYLRERTLSDAIQDAIPGAGDTFLPAGLDDGLGSTLASRFNGLVYSARTNRYPWNPNTNGANPWNPALPNATSGGVSNEELLAMDPPDRATAFAANAFQTAMKGANQQALHQGGPNSTITKALQAYTLAQAPAFPSTQFHHGVRLLNGADTTWAFDGVSAPAFGTGKTAVVTPNLLYVQGNLNTTKKTVQRYASPSAEDVPFAVMADQVNVLSAGWNDVAAAVPGLTADANGLTSNCLTLTPRSAIARGMNAANPLPTATATELVAAVVTHNQPTTRESVINGEQASIINAILHLENWSGVSFTYRGSLVVLDSRRYTASYQLADSKGAGPSPFGYMGSTWRTKYGYSPTTQGWDGVLKGSYSPPNRTFIFNPDLLTPQGTPPFAPFGTSAQGVGGWVRVLQ